MTLRIGLVAAGRITGPALVDPANAHPDVEITVVGARDLTRAKDAAARWGARHAVGSWHEVWEHDDVDAVYIATPAGYHRSTTIAALEAGKHVLCEKPLASNAAEAAEMVAAATGADRILMEAFHWRYHPMVDEMSKVLASGELGQIIHGSAVFDLPNEAIARSDIRWNHSIGGGSLMDLGCYPVQWLKWAFGDGAVVTSAAAVCPEPLVDGRITARLEWPSGVTGDLSSSMIEPDGRKDISLTITGTKGTMVALNPLAPQRGATIDVVTTTEARHIDVVSTATYAHQLDAFVTAVSTGVPPVTSGNDSIETMRIIDEIYTAAGIGPRPRVA